MKALHQSQTGRLVKAFVTELNMESNALVYGAVRKVVDAKNTDESLRALEYLLQSIIKGQGNTDYLYNSENY